LIQPELNIENIGVINGAQSGYGAEQEARLGISLARDVKPDIIILSLYPNNDIEDDFVKGYKNINVEYGYRLRKDRILPVRSIDFIRTHSFLWMFIENRYGIIQPDPKYKRFKKLSKSKPEKVVRPSLNALRELHDFCEQNNIQFGVIMIPTNSGPTIYDESIRAALNEYDIDVLDLSKKGFNNNDYIIGDGHWNENGHQKAARHLVPFVKQLKKSRISLWANMGQIAATYLLKSCVI
jgi:hypothetical protein